jgi:TolB-like protein
VRDDLQAIKTGAEISATPEEKSSIAVLPLENMSDDPEQEYFCDGLAAH